jgi:hypothetical protein
VGRRVNASPWELSLVHATAFVSSSSGASDNSSNNVLRQILCHDVVHSHDVLGRQSLFIPWEFPWLQLCRCRCRHGGTDTD